MVFLKALLVFLAVCQLASASFKVACLQFAFAYMDPIVTPGARPGHEHSIGGSLGFTDRTVTKWMAANESTCDVIGDFSNYWAPVLWRTDLGPSRVKMTPILAPYYQYDGVSAAKMNLDIFLKNKNLSMVMGKATGQTPLNSKIDILCKQNGVKVVSPVRGWHPSVTNCDELRIDYTFPSCYNGKAYSADQSHVAYKVWDKTVQRTVCPSTHPNEFPEVRLEQRYPLSPTVTWTNGKAPFVFSSGDIYTAHADANLVWNVPTLQTLTSKCQGMTINCIMSKYGVVQRSLKQQQAIATAFTIPPQYK